MVNDCLNLVNNKQAEIRKGFTEQSKSEWVKMYNWSETIVVTI